jgi:amino acid transporter
MAQFVCVRGYSCDMNTQGKLFRISGLVAAAGIALALILMIAFAGVRGDAVTALMTVVVSLLVIAAASLCVALAAYREQGRKPGSTPLIYAVIAFPLGFVLFFVYFALQFPPLMMIALLAIATSIPALIIGIVKKLSLKPTPVPVSAETVP